MNRSKKPGTAGRPLGRGPGARELPKGLAYAVDDPADPELAEARRIAIEMGEARFAAIRRGYARLNASETGGRTAPPEADPVGGRRTGFPMRSAGAGRTLAAPCAPGCGGHAGGLARPRWRALRGGFFDSLRRLAAALPAALARPAGRRRPSGRGAAGLTARAGLAAFACVAFMSFAAPVQAQDVELVGNLTQATGTPYVVNSREYAMPFATGTNSGGYNLTSVDLDVRIVPSSITNLEVQIWSSQTDAMNNVSPNAELHTLTNPASLSIGANTFAAPSNTVLAADTTYYVLVRNETSDPPALQWNGNIATGQTGLTGWSIGGGVRRDVGSTDAWATYATPHRRFKLTGSAVGGSNNVPVFADATLTRSVAENSVADTSVGAVIPAATDADTGDTLVYSMEGTDMASFNFNVTTRQITTKSGVTYNFEATKNTYAVTIRVSDGTDSDTVAVTISLTNVNELPTAPTGLTVAPTLGAGGSLDASWTAPTNTGKPTITGYKLQYSTSSSGPWSNGPQNVTGTSSTFTTGLSENTLYYVRVLAFNSDGDGVWSSTDSATTTIATTITNCPAPTLTGRSQIWSATVSLETGDVNNLVPYIGFNTVTPHDVFGALSDTSFEVGTNSYTVRTLATLPTASDALFLGLNSHVTDTEKAELTLHVCDVAVALSSATQVDAAGFKAYQWVYGVDWSDYATREAYLSVPRTNTAPTAANGSVATATNTAYTFDAGDFNFADTDSGDTLEKVKIVTLPDAGTLALSGTTVTVNQEVTKADIDADNLTFTPVTDATGSPYTTFTFKVNDGDDESASAYTMTVNVRGNTDPVFSDATLTRSLAENSGADVDVGAVIPAATDADTGDTLVYSMEGADADSFSFDRSARQIVTRQGVTYDFEATKNSYSVTIRVSDGIGSDTVVVTINLTDVNEPPDAPAAPDVSATFGSTTSLEVTWAAPANTGKPMVIDYDLQYRVTGTTAWISGPQDVVGTTSPIAGLTAKTLYDVQVRARNAEGTGTWSASGMARTANTPPTASDGSVTGMQNHAYTFAARDFSFMDADPGDTLKKVVIGTLPGDGTLTLSGAAVMQMQEVTRTDIDHGNLKFTPVAGETGSPYASFFFKVSDGDADSTLAYTMGVNVTADVTPPLIQSARMNGTTMVLTYNEVLDESSVPGFGTYVVVVSPFGTLSTTGEFVEGRTVRLTFGNRVPAGDTAVITYDPMGGDDPTTLPLQDLAGNDAAPLDSYAVVVTDATGAPTILGTAQVGATLTASSAGIADLSGKPANAGDYTYQWVREDSDGTNPVDIPGATSSSYLVVAADLGKKLKVKVSFTDNEGYAEGPLTSAASDAVVMMSAVTVTIAADQPAYLHLLSSVTFNLTRAGPAADLANALTVNVTLSQSASYLNRSQIRTHTVTFAANAATAALTIPISRIEGGARMDGTVTARVEPGTGYGVGTPSAASTIMRFRSPAITVAIDQAAYQVREDVPGGMVEVLIRAELLPGFPAPTTTLEVVLVTEGMEGGARSPGDYVAISDSVAIPASAWVDGEAIISGSVTIINDEVAEEDEELLLLIDREAGLPIDVVELVMSDGSACQVPEGEINRKCFSTLTILADASDTPLLLDTAVVNGRSLVLTYDKDLDGDSDPELLSYSVRVGNAVGVRPAAVDADGRTVTLTLATAVTAADTVALTYRVRAMNPVIAEDGNLAAPFVALPVHNVLADSTAPALDGNPVVDGATLVLTYDEALDTGSEPAVGDFDVQVTPSGESAARRDVSDVAISGSTVTLTLASAVVATDTVTLDYTVPATNPLQDVAGNDSAALDDRAVDNDSNRAPAFTSDSVTRSVPENSASGVNVGAAIPEATDADGDDLTYTLEGADAASFRFDAVTRQITTKAGVTYDYEATKNSYAVTVRVEDPGGGADTIDVTINLVNLPAFSIALQQERILLSDGWVRFELMADRRPSAQETFVNYTATQDEAWLAAEDLEGFLGHISEEAVNISGPDFKPDAPAKGGNLTVTLQPGDGYELGSPASRTVEIVAADPLITVRADEASYTAVEDGGTVTVTLRAETIAGAPKPLAGFRTPWAAMADTATGGGTDFRDVTGSASFDSTEFTEQSGRWVATRDVEVTLVDDSTWEPAETFHIELSRSTGVFGMHRLVKLANADGTLCKDNDADDNCGATVTITDNDNAAPVFADASTTREVAENSPADTDVGAPVTATDANTGDGDALTYSLEGDDAASFAIDAATGQITTTTGVDYDFETDPSYSVTVRATDRHGASDTIAVTINLTDLDVEVEVCVAPNLSDREQVWMAEMTVGNQSIGPFTIYGYYGGAGNTYGALSEDEFQIGTVSYTVDELSTRVGVDSFTFDVGSLVPDRDAVLHVCNESFALADASYDQGAYTWQNSGLDWSAVETRNVYLSLTPLPPPELELDSSMVDGNSVELTFNEDLDENSVPPNDNFRVQVTAEDGTETRRRVREVRVRGRTVTLELESAVLPTDEVSVEYLGPDSDSDAPLKGVSGVKVPPFGDSRQLRNLTPDTVAPVLQSQTVRAENLVLTYDEALDEASTPAPDAYDVQVAPPDGTAERFDVTAVKIGGETVTLTLASPVRPSEIVTLAYAVPASNPVQDLSGNDAAAISTAVAVANETAGNRTPHILGASASGHITREVPENSGGGVKVGEPIHAEDPDGDRLTWSITRFQRTITSPDPDPNTGSHVISTEWLEWGASAYFTIDSGTGQIRTKSDVDYDYEERRSYFVEVEVVDALGALARTEVLIELTDEGEPEDSPLLAPEGLTLRKLGPSAVALSWQSPASSAAIDKHQFRLGRHPTSVDGVLGGIGPQNPANRVFRDDGWMDFPADAAGPLGHVLRGAVGGRALIHVWELKAQVRSVTAGGEASPPSNVAFMPDTAPTMVRVGVVSDPGLDGVYESGETIAVALELDEPVRVRGRPLLNLQIGGATYEARYAGLSHQFREAEVGWGANEGTILRFEHVVPADGEVDANDIAIASQVTLDGATVTDATRVGNGLPAVLSWASASVPAGSPQHSEGDPLTASFASLPGRHDGETSFTFRVAFSEAVAELEPAQVRDHGFTVTGGRVTGARRVDGESALWELTVAPTSDGEVTVALAFGRACTETGAFCAADGRMLTNGLLGLVAGPATSATRVTGARLVTGPGANGAWDVGETVTAEVTFSAAVTVQGAPTLGVTLDGVRREAAHASGEGTAVLRFSYPVAAADAGATRARLVANGFGVSNGAIGDALGRPAVLDFAVAPYVTAVAILPDPSGDGRWTAGETIEAELTFSEAVTVTGGTPTVGVTAGGAAKTAAYASGAGTASLVFAYPVTAADGTVTRAALTADSLALNGASVNASASSDLAAELGHDGVEPAVETVLPVLPALSVTDAQAVEGAGAVLAFTVRLAPAATGTVTVDWATADGTAVAGSDYTAGTGRLTFAPGETAKTVSVAVLDDSTVETGSGETVTLGLSNASGAVLADASATGTIADDDTAPVTPGTALTAQFTDVPSAHAGPFSFRVSFSEALATGSGRLVPGSFAVTGATVTGVRKLGVESSLWEVSVRPRPGEDAQVTLAGGRSCETAGAVCAAGGGTLSNSVSATVPSAPMLSISDARAVEGVDASMTFTVTLAPAASGPVTVDYATGGGSATAGQDYTGVYGRLRFAAGETSKTIEVAVLEDSHDEDEEIFHIVLYGAAGAYIADGAGRGTISNTDAMPQAWLARFGRTVAEQVIEAVEGRFSASRTAGVEMTFAGQRIGSGGAAADDEAAQREAAEAEARSRLEAMKNWLQGTEDTDAGHDSRSVTPREILTGSSFALTGEAKAGGTVSLWGRGAVSRFNGRAGALSLDGEVVSALLGADWARERWTAGLLVSRSVGDGGYRSRDGSGTVESALTGFFPYGRYAANDRVTVWGIAGYGAGELTLTPGPAPDADPGGQSAMRTDMDLAMGAVGLRGVAVQAPAEGGVELAVKTDAMAVRTTSEKTQGLAAAAADVTRLRLGLEGTWRGLKLGTGTLAPTAEIGVRHDGGDAETGFGLDLGGGLAWSDPESGLSAELRARGLLTHESRGFRDRGLSGSFAWDPGRGTGRGPKLTLTQTVGASASGGADALLGRGTLEGLAANDNRDDLANRRLELRLGYGFSAFGDRFTSTPELGLGLSSGRREYSLGWRLDLAQGGPNALELKVEATRRESANENAAPEHGVGLRVTARW